MKESRKNIVSEEPEEEKSKVTNASIMSKKFKRGLKKNLSSIFRQDTFDRAKTVYANLMN